ncbi:MAG: HlyD family efflux transporter periplasmic adaptor subunit [Thermoanaerobaculia bacterium]
MTTPVRTITVERPAWEQDAPIVPRELPGWFVPALAWLLIALFAAAVLIAVFVRLPETVNSRFVLVPEGGADPIQSPRHAVIEQVRVRPGQRVSKGETLFVMRVDEVREWRTETDSREEALRALHDRSRKLEEAHASAMHIKDSEIDQAAREIQVRTTHLQVMRDLTGRLEKLAGTGLVSQIELASQKLALAQSEKDLELAGKTLAQRRLERERMDTDRKRQRLDEKADENELNIRIAALRQPLAASANGMLEIRAPYDAFCVSIVQQSAGGVVAPGEQLCQLSPVTSRLQARLDVPESGVSRLRPHQQVRLLFDAFPYQRYGVARGTLDWISPAAVARQEGSEFVAVASLDRPVIVAGGNTWPLRAGMKGEARVTIGRRALLEYAVEPLRKMHENLAP